MDNPEAGQNSVSYIPVKKDSVVKAGYHRLCCCCTSVLVPAIIALVTSFMVYKHMESIYRKECQQSLEPDTNMMTIAQRQVATETVREQTPWASYNLAQDLFYKGIDKLPWETDEIGTTGLLLTDKYGFQITQTGLYEVYSKLTFEFTPQNTSQNAYHNLNLISPLRNISILEKNVITVPDLRLRQKRSFSTSDLFLLRRLKTGDVISVEVSNTSLVYHSKIDNTVKIIKRA